VPEPASKPIVERTCLLIVDDEPLNRELLRRVLHREYDIEEAEDASQALVILNACADKIDLILCDQLMPGLSGTELAQQVRDKWPRISFLLLTGYDDDPAVQAAHGAGLVRDVVAKPWRGSALKARIHQLLDSAPANS
jgi:response regulator RpfG family c-di-GMP phosphodiesterase